MCKGVYIFMCICMHIRVFYMISLFLRVYDAVCHFAIFEILLLKDSDP